MSVPISPRENEGYREYLDLGDLVRVRRLLDEVIALAQRAAVDSRLKLVWYGDQLRESSGSERCS
jgi:hypothetical protein